MNIKVEWTGKWPCLCYGEWKLTIDGEDKSNLIPEELRESEMNTYGSYSQWRFEEDWEVVWENYVDGMPCRDWIENNKYWLDNISSDYNIQEQLYCAFQTRDWRHGSCGGCI